MKKRKQATNQQRRDYSWLLIFAAVVGVYLPALNGGLLWDDPGHLTRPDLQPVHGLWRIWTEVGATQQYYPMLHSAFWLEHRLWGDSLFGYHLINVALHATGALLLVLILRRLAVKGALLAGLIFALHPVCVESVAWISEQKNTLSAVFYLSAALVYLHFDESRSDPRDSRHPHSPRDRWYWLAFGLFMCALLSKTVTATLPAALLVVLWWHRGSLSWKRDMLPLVPWFAVAAIIGTFSIWFEREVIGARGDAFALTLIERVLLAGRVFWFYLGKLVWPDNLIFIYPRWTVDASLWWQYVFPLAAIALGAALWVLARRYRGPLAGYLFFCGTLVPVLGFVNVYPFRFSYVADHFQYLASLGVIVPLAAAAASTAERLTPQRRRLLEIVAATVLAALAVTTWNRSAVYRDAETLYKDTTARNPEAWMAHQNLGTELANQDRLEEAMSSYEAALRIKPDYDEARRNLALAHLKRGAQLSGERGRAGQGMAQLREALRLNPNLAEAHYLLGNALADSDAAGAIRHYESALEIDPNLAEVHLNLGSELSEVPSRLPDAIRHYETALKIKPDYFQAHYNLGTLLLDVPDRGAEAIAHLEDALKIQPDSVEAHVNLGIALSKIPSRSREAIAHLEFALARRPDLAPVRDVLMRLKSPSPVP